LAITPTVGSGKILPESISLAQQKSRKRSGNSLEQNVRSLTLMIWLSKHTAKTIYIIDGLDELDGKEAEKVLRVVQELSGSKTEQNGSRIAIFSRDQIAPYLLRFVPDTIHISASNNIEKDLQLYIETVVEDKICVRGLTSDSMPMEETKQKLSEGASGM
jgi:hypothetical protein